MGKGTGLGLSMIHGFAQQSGGMLSLKSKKGHGTTAEIWLPVAQPRDLPEQVPAPDTSSPPTQQPLSVLVVDDDPLVLMNTTAMLEDLGHEVLEATSGEQALRILRRSSSIDLVITDQLMPGMMGTQLIEAVRSSHPDLPLILATGYAELPVGTAPGVTHLDKPFLQRDLSRAIVATMRSKAGQVLPFPPKNR